MKRIQLVMAVMVISAEGFCQQNVTAKYNTQIYGSIKADSVYNNHGSASDDYLMYTTSNSGAQEKFMSSARATRLGFTVSREDKIDAKIETDFLGLSENVGGAAGSTTDLRLRHAYVNMKFGALELLAGQTWHLTPLELPATNNDFYLGYSGCLWYRVPQLRITWKPSGSIKLAAAAARATRKLTDAEGTASGKPGIEANAEWSVSGMKFVLSGALGSWKNAAGQTGDVRLVDAGFNIPFSIFTLNGQVWTGENLYDFLGGIGNIGYNGGEVKASGGFADLKIKPAGAFWLNAGCGIDAPEAGRIAASATSKTRNSTVFGNINLLVMDAVTATFETDLQTTRYKLVTGNENRENLHYQLSFLFPF